MKALLVREFGTLGVVRLGRTDWRVSSATAPEELLGYIERQRSGRFEITWMTDPVRWGYAASFDEALVAFGDSVRFTGDVFDQRAEVLGGRRETRASSARRASWRKPNGRSSVA